jgi:hypothetical protein
MAGQGCDAMRRAALQQQHQLLLCSGRGAGQGPEPTNNRVLFVIGVTLKPLPWPLVAVLGGGGGVVAGRSEVNFTFSQDGTLLLYPVASIMASNCSSLPSANLTPLRVTSFTAPTTWRSCFASATHH